MGRKKKKHSRHSNNRRKPFRITPTEELYRYLWQANISAKNIDRIKQLAGSEDAKVAALANVIAEVARVKPGKRRRLPVIAAKHPEVLRLMATGLDDEYWDRYSSCTGGEPWWAWEKFYQLREEIQSAPYRAQLCWCDNGLTYWGCCARRDHTYGMDTVSDLQLQFYRAHAELVPWWHPLSEIDHYTRASYEMWMIDPDHPLAFPPPEEWEALNLSSSSSAGGKGRARRAGCRSRRGCKSGS